MDPSLFRRLSEGENASPNRMKPEAMPRPVPADRSETILQTIIEGAYQGKIDEIVKL